MDALLNFNISINPLLNKFNFRIIMDLDPGLTQVSALYPNFDMGIGLHDKYLTIGENIGKPYCSILAIGLDWITLKQPIDYWKLAS